MVTLKKGVKERESSQGEPTQERDLLVSCLQNTLSLSPDYCSFYKYVLCPDCVQGLFLPCRSLF